MMSAAEAFRHDCQGMKTMEKFGNSVLVDHYRNRAIRSGMKAFCEETGYAMPFDQEARVMWKLSKWCVAKEGY